ncbi:beta-ketoacyl synthase chain length factor [Agarivorans sp. QJM3NY_33]|uniref:beta-ketoacyl synthase chain length factor n=1 Tax=Agarivorans sp. QJM3NY_33 TaxID=3421432 RepID=UPI003D7EEC20
MGFRFNLRAWLPASSQGMVCVAQQHSDLLGEVLPNKAIPASIKRRASQLTRITIAAASGILEAYPCDYIIFASQHGELTRTHKLLQELAQHQQLSPTAFAQSVHSTAPGLLTISNNFKVPFTTISARKNTVHAALLEGLARLNRHPKQSIIIIFADESIPEFYHPYIENHQQSLLILQLSHGDEWLMTIEQQQGSTKSEDSLISQLTEGLLSKQSFSTIQQGTVWLWTKHNA